MSDIAASSAKSVAIGPFGSDLKSNLYTPDGVPVVRGTNIGGGRELVGDFAYVSDETAAALPGAVLRRGDLFFPHRGAIGRVGIVEGNSPMLMSTSLMKLTCDPAKADPLFVFYYFRSHFGRTGLLAHASTVGTPGIGRPLTSLRAIPLTLPPLGEQRAIASVLGALDDKIVSNCRLSAAQRLVRATGYRRAAERCSKRVPLTEFVDHPKRTVHPASMPDRQFQQFSIPAFDKGQDPDLCSGSDMKSSKTLLPDGDVLLLSKLNPSTWRVWNPVREPREVAVCSPEFVAITARVSTAFAWLESAIRWDAVFREEVLAAVSGSTGSRQRVKPSDVLTATIPRANGDSLRQWNAFAGPLIAREAALVRESRRLTAIRDNLLPKLISGQVRVPLSDDVEEQVGAATEAVAATS